jgi:hypothetical protein
VSDKASNTGPGSRIGKPKAGQAKPAPAKTDAKKPAAAKPGTSPAATQVKTQPAKTAPAKTQAAVAQQTTAAAKQVVANAQQQAAEQSEEELEDEEESQGFFGRQMIWASTAFGSSMLVHIALLLMLGLITVATGQQKVITELVANVVERPDEVLTQVLEEKIEPSKDLALVSTSLSAVQGAGGSVSAMSEPKVAAQPTDAPTTVKVDIGEVNVFKSNGTHLSQELPEGTFGEAAAVADSIGDAMDRMTSEILNKLAKGKVLVVWCFDQSESMKDDREEIMARIDRVYKELGVAKSAQGDALLTAVASYGQKAQVHTKKPTSNVDEIIEAMNEVPIDESGMEVMCQAIGFSINQHRKFASQGQRQMMVILVTDESGDPNDNFQSLESTIAEAKASRCPIYCLGREAIFGFPYARIRWEDPKTGIPFWIQIDRGPETPYPEQLQIDGFHRRWDAHPSGFGPYEQARMARQTGGVFFMLPSPEANLVGRDDRKYALEAMRPYLPDLSARSDYAAERDKYDMRKVLWKVISDLNPYKQTAGKTVEVRVDHFPIDKADFAKEAQKQMDTARQIIVYLEEAEKALEKVKPLREREESPRWRANFDLMYGQVLAYQVRLYEYGTYLDFFTKNPKPIKNIHGPKKPTNGWDIRSVAATITGDKFKAKKEKANEVFKQIIKEHAGTPYSARAQYELNRGYGVDMYEDWDDPRRPGVRVPKL